MKSYNDTFTHFVIMTVGVCSFLILWVMTSFIVAITLYRLITPDHTSLIRCIVSFTAFSAFCVNFGIWFIGCFLPTTMIDDYFANKWMLKHGKVHMSWID